MNAPLTVTSTIGKYNILILYHSLQYASNHILIKHSTILYQVVRKKLLLLKNDSCEQPLTQLQPIYKIENNIDEC